MNLLFYVFFSLGLFIMSTQVAQAYLDPGSGSLLFQLLVGGVLSAMFAIKLYYRKIKLFLKQLLSSNKGITENDESEKN